MRNLIWCSSFILLAVAFCSVNTAHTQEYKLVWSDEFEGSAVDTETWNFWEGPAYNNELQYYTPRNKNAYVKDGKLYLEAHRENYRGKEFTSARVSADSTSIG